MTRGPIFWSPEQRQWGVDDNMAEPERRSPHSQGILSPVGGGEAWKGRGMERSSSSGGGWCTAGCVGVKSGGKEHDSWR